MEPQGGILTICPRYKSNRNYEGTAARKPRSDKKITPDFVTDIQAIDDNDPRKSVGFIARDMEVSEFLIRQIVHEDIRYSSYKMRKG